MSNNSELNQIAVNFWSKDTSRCWCLFTNYSCSNDSYWLR